ncbi:hypothetical protein [Nocardioides sp. WS12]|uniref:hypothetical protein n=1 Tax=Nocardioides sp. WS12 TaxID=2486272 RepID=UPI0015FB5CAF|nr:hypothetical protein [Nocardioides sp. WS12]
MTESGSPFPPPPTPAYVPVERVMRRSMVLRHLLSVGFALVATPVGILLFDYGASEYGRRHAYFGVEGSNGAGHFALMFAGAVVLMAVAGSARVSGLGPIVAGFVWGLIPLLWYVIDVNSFFQFAQDLPSTHFWFPTPPHLFGLVAALLVGSGLAGRWRGQPRPAVQRWP